MTTDLREEGRKRAISLAEQARSLKAEGSREEAKEKYRESLKIENDPMATNIMKELCQIFLEEGDMPGAEDVWRGAAIWHRSQAYLYYAKMADIYEERKCIDDAIRILREGTKLTPYSSMAYYYLGRMCLRHRYLKEAEESFREAIKRDSGNSHLYLDLVMTLIKDNRSKEVCELIDTLEQSKTVQGYWLQELKKERDKMLAASDSLSEA